MLTLHHSPLLPTCRKIRLMLREKNIPHALQNEDFWLRDVNFFALNPAGEVPVLVTSQQQIIVSAYAIAEFLDEMYPDVQFFGNSALERAEVRRLTDWFDAKFDREVTQLVLFEKIYKRLMGYGDPSADAIRAGKKNILYHLEYLSYLLQTRNWLAGDYLTLADITAASHLSCLDYLGDVAWEQFPNVKEWYSLIKCRPAFRDLLDDRIQGFRPPAHYMDVDF